MMCELPEAIRQMKMTADLAPCGIGLFEIETSAPVFLNRAYYALIGYTEEECRAHGNDPAFLLLPKDEEITRQSRAEFARHGKAENYEYRIVRRDGQLRWIKFEVSAVTVEGKAYAFASFTDITRVREIEEKTAREQHCFHLVVDEMDAAVFEWDFKSGSFYSSAAYQKYAISRVAAEDILHNRGPADIVHPDDREILRDFYAQTTGGKARAEATFRMKMVDGSYRWCRLLGFFYKDETGARTHTVGVILDVNEEHERNFMMSRLLNAMPGGVGIFVFAEKLLCNFYSDGFAKMAGIPRAEMDQKIADNTVLSSLIAPVDYPTIAPVLAQRTAAGLPLNLTYRYIYADGSLRWLHLAAEKMGEQDGAPVYYCVFTTPTEETALYRSLVEDSAVGVFVAERATRAILYVNTAADALSGFPHEGDKTGQIVSEATCKWGTAPLLTQAQIDALRFEDYTEFHVARGERYLAIKARAILWNGVDAYILYISDETAEHQNQVELQKLIDEVPGGIGIYDIRGGKARLTYLNDAYYKMLGTPRETRGQYYGDHIFDAVHPEDRATMQQVVAKIIAGQDHVSALHRVCNAAGEWIWLNFEAAAIERGENSIRVYAAIANFDAVVRAQQAMRESRKREQALLTSMPGAIATYRLKKDGRFTFDYASKSLAKLCGYADFDEFYERYRDDAMSNIAAEDAPKLAAQASECLRTRSALSAIFHLHTKNGPDLLTRLDANLIDGAVLGEEDVAMWYAVHTLVSEDTRRAMREQHRYRSLMNALDMVLLEWEQGSDFYASKKFQQYALSQQDYHKILTNQADTSVVHPDDLPVLKEFFGQQGTRRTRTSTTLRMRMCDGTYRWTEMLGFYEYGEDGRLCRVIGVLRDVDKERMEQNERLRHALREAEKANQAKTSFLSRVSHDMRTPLNGILGLTALMKDISADPRITQDLNQLEISGQYLLTLINDTLDVSRIESNRLELHPSVCDSRVVFNNVQRLTRPGMELKEIRMEVKADNLPFTYLYVDEGRLEQVAMNILGNAVKFSPPGSVIHVTAENLSVENGLLTDRFVIEDSGCGMSKEFLPHLFEPFSQENAGTTNSNQGTGLGMAITKRLVELMGGEIMVTSEPGRGTRFEVTLRLPIATKEQVEEWRRTATAHAINYNLNGKRVLLCEDHPLNTKIATRLLAKEGMLVEHAENGKLGVAMFAASAPGYYDAILMDIRMPVMDGIDATIAIRALDRADARRITIIAMTANALDDDVKRTREAGMDAHLSKPIDPARLYAALEQFLNPAEPYMRRRILIVDDVALNRAVIRAALEPDYEVFEAESGARALELLQEKNGMDAMVTDIQMPGMDGLELIRRTRANEAYRHMVVIANTQYENPGQEEMLLALGANDFIYKPANPDIVRIRIRNALHKI